MIWFKYLVVNQTGDEGCLHWPNLQSIFLSKEHLEYLDSNKIGNEGCLHLSKAHWPNLWTIYSGKEYIKLLGYNEIGQVGFAYFCKWSIFEIIYLYFLFRIVVMNVCRSHEESYPKGPDNPPNMIMSIYLNKPNIHFNIKIEIFIKSQKSLNLSITCPLDFAPKYIDWIISLDDYHYFQMSL